MRTLGLDLGSRTCGIALSDPMGILATGLETFRFAEGNVESLLDYLVAIVHNNNVSKIVLGHPKNMDGSIGSQGLAVEAFRDRFQTLVTAPIVLWDERLTSRMAEQVLLQADFSRKRRKETVDKLAATVILQSYLDSRK
jgi:putative holliday junction resolvase